MVIGIVSKIVQYFKDIGDAALQKGGELFAFLLKLNVRVALRLFIVLNCFCNYYYLLFFFCLFVFRVRLFVLLSCEGEEINSYN